MTFHFSNDRLFQSELDHAVHKQDKIVLASPKQLVPMNSQATLQFKAAFFTLYLPITIGQDSDIWRSYIAQALFRRLNLSLHFGYMPRPIVTKIPTKVNLTNENKTGSQITKLLDFILNDSYNNHIESLEEVVEQFWIDMYERGLVDEQDVVGIGLWLESLASVWDSFGPSSKNCKLIKTKSNNFNMHGTPVNGRFPKFPQICEVTVRKNPKHFWVGDFHEALRCDGPTVLKFLGQKVVLASCKSNYTNYPILEDGRLEVQDNISPQIKKYWWHNHNLTRRDVEENLSFYKNSNDTYFHAVDAFMCSFPPPICEFWMPLNLTKSIIFAPSHRYNMGRCTVKEWTDLNNRLWQLEKSDRHFIAPMTRYDFEYLKYYTGITKNGILPTLSTFYLTMEYQPIKESIFCLQARFTNLHTLVFDVKGYDFKFPPLFSGIFWQHFELNEIVKHKAIVMFPYSVHAYKLTELYSVGIPIFVPSAKLIRESGGFGPDRAVTSEIFCKLVEHDANLDKKMLQHPNSHHPYSPNTEFAEDPEAEMYWLQFSDFYDWPHIQTFDSAKDLEEKLDNLDIWDVHEKMKNAVQRRQFKVLSKWCSFLNNLNHH